MEKKSKSNRRINTRPLTNSEKFLLTALGVVLIVFISYRFILTPQAAKIEELEVAKMDYDLKIMENNNTLMKERKIIEELQELTNERDVILANYFPTLDQPQIIYLLNDLVYDERVDISDLSFSRANPEQVGELNVMKMDVSIPFNGNYDGIMSVVNSLGHSPRRIVVDSLSMDRTNSTDLAGSMGLKIYSLEGLAETDPNVIYIDTTDRYTAGTPFGAYGEYTGDRTDEPGTGEGSATGEPGEGGEGEEVIEIETTRTVVLSDFENKKYSFIPSGILANAFATTSSIRKSGKYSLRLEYNILAVEEENRAYVDLSTSNINLSYPPQSIGIWVYSYGYSPATIGLGFHGQMGEDEYVPLSEGIGWTGWKYLEISPPNDLSIYPLDVNSFYIDMPKNREDFGVLIVDRMEAVYERNISEDGVVEEIPDNIFHVVKVGDTIENISLAYYGTVNYKNEILRLNEMKASDILPVGKVLVLRKR